MSHLTEINCSTVLEEIKKEKLRQNQQNNHSNFTHSFKSNQIYLNSLFVKGGDFVNINPEESAFWTDLFANCFLCFENHKNDESITNTLNHDDMLFFVSKIEPEQVI